jgi:hypothetical protein
VPESEPSDSASSTGIPVDLDHEVKAAETETEPETEIGEEKRGEGGTEPPRDQQLGDEPGVDIDMDRAVRHVRRRQQKGGDGFYGVPEPMVCLILISCVAS